MKLLPYQRRGLYCHSGMYLINKNEFKNISEGLPDDLGIQYQSYQKSAIVAEDSYITLHPGLGHTGSEPFDEQRG